MLAANQFPIANAGAGVHVSAHGTPSSASRRPAWMNRLLAVRPTPTLLESTTTEQPKHKSTVEGVSTASAFRSHPR